MPELTPLSLQNTPSLIEKIFPAQIVSFEAQQERTAVQSQTLTGLGSYWKGRKPLILARAVVLGSLLPQTADAERDLEIFEKLMAFDKMGLARRALKKNSLKPKSLASLVELRNPWDYFAYTIKGPEVSQNAIDQLCFPIDADHKGISLRWRRDVDENTKIPIYLQALSTFSTYEEKAALCQRPEEIDQDWLYESVWQAVNDHYAHLGVQAHSHHELVEQLGILRYGRRPKVGDTFAGGGSIPFEAARLGCDTYASDLNPIACMLTWGSLNIIGAPAKRRSAIEKAQREIVEGADKEIASLGIEYDQDGNRAKAYLHCLEARCPETGWMVPMAPSWVVSKSRNVIARLTPNRERKRFEIEIISNVSADELKAAERGTVQDGSLIYTLDSKTHRTPVKTLRGDYRDADGVTQNRLRQWRKHDIRPAPDDVFQERLYAIQWVTEETLDRSRKQTFFSSATVADLERELKIEEIVQRNLARWQVEGLVPDMEIEHGKKTDELIRTRGWTHWHHLFSPRQLLVASIVRAQINQQPRDMQAALCLSLAKMIDWSSKLCRYGTGAARESITQTFYNQAYNTNYSYGVRSFVTGRNYLFLTKSSSVVHGVGTIANLPAGELAERCDLWITDPPYADAVSYHEISEFFIAWLRKDPPSPLDQWTWDSRRALAIKGAGDNFRRGMVGAYRTMTQNMPDNGMQCVMFTHQDTGVWSDMVGIFWAAGLQVVAAWYIATETTSELRKGGYVQGTVILMLRKRSGDENLGFKQRILPAVRNEVTQQIRQMMHLNDEVEQKLGESVFNDSDLQMAGYAAALKILTAYTHIGGEDVTSFSVRPRRVGEVTVVDEIVQQAAEAANSLLVPEGLAADTWQRISGIQRFYLRMVDMETTGASKLDNYQNFAKAFRVDEYTKVMGNMTANRARLKRVSEFGSRDLTDGTELGATWLGRLIIGLQQLLKDTEPQVVISQLQMELPDFMEVRPLLIDMLQFLQTKAPEEEVRHVAEVLANRLHNLRALGQ